MKMEPVILSETLIIPTSPNGVTIQKTETDKTLMALFLKPIVISTQRGNKKVDGMTAGNKRSPSSNIP